MTRRELDALTFPGVRRHRMRREAQQAARPLTRREILVELAKAGVFFLAWLLLLFAMAANEPAVHPHEGNGDVEDIPVAPGGLR